MKKIFLITLLLTITIVVEANKYYFRTIEYVICKWDWYKETWNTSMKWTPSKSQELIVLNTDNSSITINGTTYYVKELIEGPRIEKNGSFYVLYLATNDCEIMFKETADHKSAQVWVTNEDATQMKGRKLFRTR